MVMPKKFFFKAGVGGGKQGALSEHGESNFWVCAWNPMEWPFKENLYLVCILSLWMKSYGVTIQMKPLQQYFHMLLFI